MPRKTRGHPWRKPRATESVTENKPPWECGIRNGEWGVKNGPRAGSFRTPRSAFRTSTARVKRRGKSPPPGAQAPGHEKPHAVQDRTGRWAACPPWRNPKLPGNSRIRRSYGPGTPRKRREINDHPRQNSAYRHPPTGALSERKAPLLFLKKPPVTRLERRGEKSHALPAQRERGATQVERFTPKREQLTSQRERFTSEAELDATQVEQNAADDERFTSRGEKFTSQHERNTSHGEKFTSEREQLTSQREKFTSKHEQSTSQRERFTSEAERNTSQIALLAVFSL